MARPRVTDPGTEAQILRLLAAGRSLRAVAKLTGVSKDTVRRVLKAAERGERAAGGDGARQEPPNTPAAGDAVPLTAADRTGPHAPSRPRTAWGHPQPVTRLPVRMSNADHAAWDRPRGWW